MAPGRVTVTPAASTATLIAPRMSSGVAGQMCREVADEGVACGGGVDRVHRRRDDVLDAAAVCDVHPVGAQRCRSRWRRPRVASDVMSSARSSELVFVDDKEVDVVEQVVH